MEARGVVVLPGASRRAGECVNAHQFQPVSGALIDKLGPIVAANVPGYTKYREQFGERVNHVLTRDASVHL